MTRQIPWLRILAEGVVIVVSILLAFGIDAWWDGRQRDEDRRELLATMLESVQLTEAVVTRNVGDSQRNRELAARFYTLPVAHLAQVPRDTAAAFLNSLAQPNTVMSSRGPLSRLVEGGQLGLVQDEQVLAAIDEWLAVAAELDERAANLAGLEVAVVTALSVHTAVQQRNLQGRDGLPEVVDLRPIRADPDVVRAAGAHAFQRGVYILWSGRFLETLARLETLLATSLE